MHWSYSDPLLNSNPSTECSSTAPVKNPDLGEKLVKNAQLLPRFEFNPNHKPILKNHGAVIMPTQ